MITEPDPQEGVALLGVWRFVGYRPDDNVGTVLVTSSRPSSHSGYRYP